MKKIILLLLSIFFIGSCTSFNSKIDVYTFKPYELKNTMKLGEITIKPIHGINGIETILPEIITSVADENNIVLLPKDADSDLFMDVFIHRKSYLKGFNKYESVTLMLKISNSRGMVSNTVFTRDSQIPLDSFSKIYEIFQAVMPEIQREYLMVQKKIG